MKRTILAACVAALAAAPALAHDEDNGSLAGLGAVSFPNSCSGAAKDKFVRGVAMLHSFWYSAGERAFQEAAAEDPGCAPIAAWGFASILMSNPLAGIGAAAKDAPRAIAAIEKGRAAGAKTERERDYLEAVAAYYDSFGQRSERERQVARAKAYEAVAAKYPSDDEAQIFYALYLAGTQLQSDQTYAAYLKAAAILEQQFAKHPNHPGVAHYLIHSYDAPPIAAKGVPAAKRYAAIAPDAPHALHMPSHIFTRVGAWEESAATNRRSATVAEKANDNGEALHAMDYMVYAYLQQGRDEDAAATYREAAGVYARGINVARFTAPYAIAAMQARCVVERGAWREAAALALMRQAADSEDRNEKHIVTPGRVLPARELLGDMLLEMKRPAEALEAYEQSQKREPDRLRGLYGAGRAAEMADDPARARAYYARLVQRAAKGDARPEIAHARQYLKRA